MDNFNLTKQTRHIIKEYLDHNENEWKRLLRKFLVDHFQNVLANHDDLENQTFDTIKVDLKDYIENTLHQALEENIWEILSEREMFDESRWQNIASTFSDHLNGFINNDLDEVADKVVDSYRENASYGKNKNRYFGLSNFDL